MRAAERRAERLGGRNEPPVVVPLDEAANICRIADLPEQFTVNRYHSLAIARSSLPECLEITATSEDGEIQGVRHTSLAIEGVQFHPESILTEHGHAMLKNFLEQKA